MSVPVGSGGQRRADLNWASRDRSPVCGLRVSLHVAAVCREVGIGKPWIVGALTTESAVLVPEGAELFAVLDDPALEGVVPVGVGKPVAECPGLSQAAGDLPVEQQQVVAVGDGDMSAPLGVAEDFSEGDRLGHHQQRGGGTGRWQGLGARVPAGVQLLEIRIGEAGSVPVVPVGDDRCCAA